MQWLGSSASSAFGDDLPAALWEGWLRPEIQPVEKLIKQTIANETVWAFYAVPPNSELIAEKRLTKTQPRAELVGKAAEQAAKVTGASARSATNRARLFPLLSGSKPCYIYAVEVCSQLSSAWVFMSERSPSVAIGSTFADHRTLHDRGVHRGLMQGIATAGREVPHPL